MGGLGTVFRRERRGSATPAADHAPPPDPSPTTHKAAQPEHYNERRDIGAVSVRVWRDTAPRANDMERAAEIFGLVDR